MVVWKEPCPELLLNHLVALTPRLFYPSPPHYVFTTCNSFNGWREFGNRCRQFENRRHGSCRRDRVRQPASSHCAEAGSRRCTCLTEEGVAGAARLNARVLSMAGAWDLLLLTWASKIARSCCRWVAIPILLWMTVRPDIAAPGAAEAEGRGSWADMVHWFQQSMRVHQINMILANQ
jgi:hypothetical protein